MFRALPLLALCACAAPAPPRPAPLPPETTVVAGDAPLYVRSFGGGPTSEVLVVLHGGWGLSHEYLLPLSALASPRLQVVFYDQRGVGRSGGVVAGDVLAQALHDLDRVRRATGRARAHVAGHSAGGLNAMAYAARYPDAVQSLILIDSVPPTRAALDEGYAAFNRRLRELAKQGVITVETASLDAWLASVLPAYFADPGHPAARAGLGGARATPGITDLHLDSLGAYDLRRPLQNLPVRSFVYFADVPFGAMGREAAKVLPPGRTVEVSYGDCGHLPWIECPDRFLAALREFLGQPSQWRASSGR
jgi:proline iminopeptidase